ncbi:MAG: DUF58 domain-containing protein [Bdellovibrionota bacterium]
MNNNSFIVPKSNLTGLIPSWLKTFRIPSFTSRGLISIGLGTYLIYYLGSKQEDIIASLLGIGLIAGALFISILAFAQYFYSKKNLKIINFIIEGSLGELRAGENSSLGIKLSKFSILPLFKLSLLPKLNTAVSVKPFFLSGKGAETNFLSQKVIFPHRGIWPVKFLEFRLEDMFGLTSFSWQIELPKDKQKINVKPKKFLFEKMPLITSCQKPGDLLFDEHNRHGDPFDIKRYHPSDSAKKILWKVFAKRRELLSRHPEASMSPEGISIIVSTARTTEDHVAQASIVYVSELANTEIDAAALIRGNVARSIATNESDLENLSIESAWNANHQESLKNVAEDLEVFINKLSRDGITAPSILVFLDSTGLDSKEAYNDLISFLEIIDKSSSPVIFDIRSQLLAKSKLTFTNNFLTFCSKKAWQLIQIN